jgi:hypothetical protein
MSESTEAPESVGFWNLFRDSPELTVLFVLLGLYLTIRERVRCQQQGDVNG